MQSSSLVNLKPVSLMIFPGFKLVFNGLESENLKSNI